MVHAGLAEDKNPQAKAILDQLVPRVTADPIRSAKLYAGHHKYQ